LLVEGVFEKLLGVWEGVVDMEIKETLGYPLVSFVCVSVCVIIEGVIV
jgi:hypothetical protein